MISLKWFATLTLLFKGAAPVGIGTELIHVLNWFYYN